MFLRGCSDHRDKVFHHVEIKIKLTDRVLVGKELFDGD